MPERTVCDAQEHATEESYRACPICNPPPAPQEAPASFMTDAQMLADVEGRLDYRRAEAEELRTRLYEAEQEMQRLKARIPILEEALGQALDEVENLRQAARANAQIMAGEQAQMTLALKHLDKLWAIAQDANEDFNFSEEGVP
jgi:hypothetical protein